MLRWCRWHDRKGDDDYRAVSKKKKDLTTTGFCIMGPSMDFRRPYEDTVVRVYSCIEDSDKIAVWQPNQKPKWSLNRSEAVPRSRMTFNRLSKLGGFRVSKGVIRKAHGINIRSCDGYATRPLEGAADQLLHEHGGVTVAEYVSLIHPPSPREKKLTAPSFGSARSCRLHSCASAS
ncbi:hypothetical protein BD324DRAFT_88063 [Kockovaella imperatae]|uniref:Uncharacterized protein n=1 Tax=Kockovaella imperatae TaxID=4999 RepID=A0A1Y1UBA4_9TREE|nr:hypothetical protein BD324DRAFT_88063 [Kockovaella imperatae]ORX35292.1 hypothetical protein BD324DRAFT_88063 [Kockovaella imperatae]